MRYDPIIKVLKCLRGLSVLKASSIGGGEGTVGSAYAGSNPASPIPLACLPGFGR